MKAYNKIVVASQLFERAHDMFESAESDTDYACSRLIAGAVVGIIAPVLKEQGGHPMHDLLARIANATAEPNDEKYCAGFFRAAYNSLKHSGSNRKGIKPSEDLEFEADVKREAAHMLDVAKADFSEIRVSTDVRNMCGESFIAVLESDREYA
ncbi:MAG: hypothetical protein QNJ78_11730 [Gammaproteobacteria bacterium]|nr:hypothetical protein [Gammaproteobacteria bacterium]